MAEGTATRWPDRMRRLAATGPGWWIAGMAVAAALLLALPGRTVTTRSLSELFYLLDGAHRVLSGQVPGRDFLTTLGPLAFWLPALGERLAGWGGALPVAMALVLLALAPVMAHVLASRLPTVLSLPTGLLLVLVLAVPINLGDAITGLSFFMFHNRIGWVALALLLLMYLPPDRPRPAADAAAAAGLTLLMVLVRPHFGLVAIAFLLFLLVVPEARRWVLAALGAVLAGLAALALWPGTAGTLAALEMAFGAGGGLWRGTAGQITEHVLANAADHVLLGLLAGLALWRRPSLRDALFFAFCAVAGFWILNHSIQRWGILSLYAGAAVAAARLLALPGDGRERVWTHPAGVVLAYVALILPPLVHFSAAFLLHVSVAVAGGGQPLPLPRMEGIRLANLWSGGDFGGGNWYLGTIQDGMAALAALDPPAGRLLVLGGPDPFSAALGLAPAPGLLPEMRWLDTIGPDHHPAPADLLSGVEIVAERLSAGGAGPAGALYLPAVAEAFTPVAETEHWRLHRRRAATP